MSGKRSSRTGVVFVLSAPSGTGKTTLTRRLARRVSRLRFSVSYTTRPPRLGERAGIDYLLSEDMQDGRRFGELTIVNPFRTENTALIDRILPP